MFAQYKVDPFVEACTIASTCLRVFRKNFLVKNTIGLMPVKGYRLAENQSRGAIRWLHYMGKKVLKRHIQHVGNGREKRLFGKVRVDGFCTPTAEESHKGIVLQYQGCYWHGCKTCFSVDRSDPDNQMNERFKSTQMISNKIRNRVAIV